MDSPKASEKDRGKCDGGKRRIIAYCVSARRRNGILVKYLRDINDHIRVIRRVDFNDPERIQRTFQEYYKILQAILNRDAAKARILIRRAYSTQRGVRQRRSP